MERYLFVLGRDPLLSLAEIDSYFKAREIKFRRLQHSASVAIIESEKISPAEVVKDLGGVSKIGEVINDLGSYQLYSGKSHKIKYAISKYSNENIEGLKEYIKRRMREEKLKAVYKKSQRQEPFLTPSEVIKHGLLKEGVELLVFNDYVAKTIAIFNPREYKARDSERPVQSPLLAISLRLAKILINLSWAKPGKILLDPFCGIGTILQEAMLMGISPVGLDINSNSLNGTKTNLEWIQKKYSCSIRFELRQGDATKLSSSVKDKVDCIATEPNLGPLLKKRPTLGAAKGQLRSLEGLYLSFLSEAKKVLREKGKMALVVPRFRTWNNKIVSMDFRAMLDKAGLRPYRITKEVEMPIVYKTPKGKIEREIWVVEQKL